MARSRCSGITVPLCLKELSYNQVWFQLVSLPLTGRLLTPDLKEGFGAWKLVCGFWLITSLLITSAPSLDFTISSLATSPATALQWQLCSGVADGDFMGQENATYIVPKCILSFLKLWTCHSSWLPEKLWTCLFLTGHCAGVQLCSPGMHMGNSLLAEFSWNVFSLTHLFKGKSVFLQGPRLGNHPGGKIHGTQVPSRGICCLAQCQVHGLRRRGGDSQWEGTAFLKKR